MSLNDKLVCVGIISKVHGVRGDVIIKSFTESPEDLLNYTPIYDRTKNKTFSFKLKRVDKKGLVVHIKGVDDRNTAETLRQTELYVERGSFKPEEEEEFYFVDLEGLEVISLEGETLGTVKSVQDLGAGVYLDCINSVDQLFSIPFRKVAVPEVFIDKGFLRVNTSFILRSWDNKEEET